MDVGFESCPGPKLVCPSGHFYLRIHPESSAERKEMLTVLCVHRWGVVGLWEAEGRCGDAAGQQREESLLGSFRGGQKSDGEL